MLVKCSQPGQYHLQRLWYLLPQACPSNYNYSNFSAMASQNLKRNFKLGLCTRQSVHTCSKRFAVCCMAPLEHCGYAQGCYVFGLLLCLPYTDYHWDCIVYLSWSIHEALTLIIVPLHCDLSYPCTIQSPTSMTILGRSISPLHSFT